MKILFFGTATFAIPSLEKLISSPHTIAAVITQPDRPKGRSQKMTSPPVKKAALDNQLPVLQPEQPNDPESLSAIGTWEADLAVVIAYGRILSKALLDLFPDGALNLHASLLPKYRGAAPIQWAIANGETQSGITVMQMDEHLDHGPILKQTLESIEPKDTAITLGERLAHSGAQTLLETIDQLQAATVTPQPQDDTAATEAPILRKADGEVNWRQPATAIHNKVRGFQPWPGMHTVLSDRAVRLLATQADPSKNSGKPPGTVVQAEQKAGLWIQTGQGQLRIDQIQPAGKKGMPAADFLRGNPL